MNWLADLKAGRVDRFLAAHGVEGQLQDLTETGEGLQAYRVSGHGMVVACALEWYAAVVLAAELSPDPPEEVLAAASLLLVDGWVEILSREASP